MCVYRQSDYPGRRYEIADSAFGAGVPLKKYGMFTGTLTLPSTLKTIGASAFSYADFSGRTSDPGRRDKHRRERV